MFWEFSLRFWYLGMWKQAEFLLKFVTFCYLLILNSLPSFLLWIGHNGMGLTNRLNLMTLNFSSLGRFFGCDGLGILHWQITWKKVSLCVQGQGHELNCYKYLPCFELFWNCLSNGWIRECWLFIIKSLILLLFALPKLDLQVNLFLFVDGRVM